MKIAQKLAFFVLVFGPLFVLGQTTGKLSGTIYNKKTQQRVLGLTVQVIPGNTKTISDSLGNFRFTQLKPGPYTLEISGLGFKTKQLNNIPVTTGNENNIQIEIEEIVNQLSNVIVTSRKSSAKRFNQRWRALMPAMWLRKDNVCLCNDRKAGTTGFRDGQHE
jgi:hypothetical protein